MQWLARNGLVACSVCVRTLSTSPSSCNGFRKEFDSFPVYSLNWFPGHMAKGKTAPYRIYPLSLVSYLGLRLMTERIRRCECVVEVHDARVFLNVPKSGRGG